MQLGWFTAGLAVTGLLTLSAVAAAQPAPAAPAAAPAGAAPAANGGAGKQLFEGACGACHDLTVSTDQRKSHDDWQATVTRMVGSGAPLNDQEAAQVVEYLSKNFGTK